MKKNILFLSFLTLTFIFGGCTNLDEKVYSGLTSENFYRTPEEVNAGLVNVYYRFSASHIWWQHWQLQECSTSHGMCRWGDGGVFKQSQLHTWTPQHGPIGDVYRGLYGTIASANSFLETLDKSSLENKKTISAEIKALRAYCYLELCDMFGNVPIVTVAKLDQLNLPKTSSRKEVFTFVETELKDALAVLPSLKDLPNKKEYYPRFVKETVQTILAKLYQNAEVYTGTARWQDCVSYCDQVINSGQFSLEPNIWNAFTPTNDQSNELILAVSKDNAKDDPSFTNWMNVLGTWGGLEGAYLNGKLGIKYGGWGGPAVLEEHYDTYENPDFRKSLILKGKYYDGSGKLLIEITPFTNSDIYAFTDKDGEGLTSIKYQPDLDDRSTGRSQRHDLVIYRYADVLLTKAEALSRIAGGTGLTSEVANLVNTVRKRNFAIYAGKEFTTKNTMDDLLAERSREFLWECSYRTDLVRFGKFTTAKTKWKKVDDAATRNIFPIPLSEVQSNPNLTQNPGY